MESDYGICNFCNRVVACRNPRGGDGSARIFRRHKGYIYVGGVRQQCEGGGWTIYDDAKWWPSRAEAEAARTVQGDDHE